LEVKHEGRKAPSRFCCKGEYGGVLRRKGKGKNQVANSKLESGKWVTDCKKGGKKVSRGGGGRGPQHFNNILPPKKESGRMGKGEQQRINPLRRGGGSFSPEGPGL